MMLALPMQGMAGVGMLHCAVAGDAAQVHAGHHAGAQAAAEGAKAETPRTTGPGACEHSACAEAAGGGHSCSACAACCAGAAFPMATPSLTLPEHHVQPGLAPALGTLSFIASGPERPPRLHLA